MGCKTLFLMLCLVGMAAGYNASVEPNLSDANNLLINGTLDSLSTLQSNSGDTVHFLLIVVFIILIAMLLYFLFPIVWGWMR